MMLRMLTTTVAAAALCAGCNAAGTPSAGPAPAETHAPPAAVPTQPTAPPAARGPMPKFIPPSHSVAAVPSGTYMIEPAHTQIMFSVLHFGITTYYGDFSGASGSLTVDAKNPSKDELDVSVPVATVHTTSPRLVEELKSAQWLDANTYPTMTFKSTKVVPTGKASAEVTGDLTLHGVTRPVTLHATFMAAGINPMMKALNVGFTVSGTINRSDFGVKAAVPMVSDATKIIISAAFAQ